MIRVFLLLLACMAGTWYLVDTIKQNGPGYVLVAYNDYTIETSFWFALLLLIVIVALIYGAIRLGVILFYYLIKLGLLPETYSRNRSAKLKNKGIQAFLDQHWSEASTQLLKAAKNDTTPFLDQLMAARAYIASSNLSAAEKCLQQARVLPDADALSLSLLELDITIGKKDIPAANTLLNNLLKHSSNQVPVLVRAITIYSNSNNWTALNTLLPKIKKQQVLDDEALLQLHTTITVGLLHAATNKKLDAQQLKTIWKAAAKVQDQPEVIRSYVASLVAIGEFEVAEKIIRQQLAKRWDEVLIEIYGQLKTKNSAQQLTYVESFLTDHKSSAALQLALARLAISNNLIGRAKECAEYSLKIKPSVDAYLLMADISEQLNDPNTARHHLKLGLKLTVAKRE